MRRLSVCYFSDLFGLSRRRRIFAPLEGLSRHGRDGNQCPPYSLPYRPVLYLSKPPYSQHCNDNSNTGEDDRRGGKDECRDIRPFLNTDYDMALRKQPCQPP